MVMRVTRVQMDQQFLLQNNISRGEESQVLEHLSTLKKVNRPSDDADNFNRIKNTQNELSESDDFKEVIRDSMQLLGATETALAGIRDALDKAREVAVGGVSIANTALERITIAEQLEQLRLEAIGYLNTKHNGSHIFSGTLTDTLPFTSVLNDPYMGNDERTEVRINKTDRVITNWTGSDIAFGPGGLNSTDDFLDALAELENAFRSNDVALVNTHLSRLQPATQRVNAFIAEVGSRSHRMISEEKRYEQFEMGLHAVLAELEDADLAEEAIKLENDRKGIDAQRRAHGTINRQFLFDFLG